MVRGVDLLGSGVPLTVLGHDLTKLLPPDLNGSLSDQQRSEINKRMHMFYVGSYGTTSRINRLQFVQVGDNGFIICLFKGIRADDQILSSAG